jgi:vancomycin resistance protein YoaR
MRSVSLLLLLIFSNISIAGIDISGKSQSEAVAILKQNVTIPEKVSLIGPSQSLDFNTKDIELSYDYESSVKRAFNYTRTGNPVYDLQQKISLLISPVNLGLAPKFNENKLTKIVSVVAGQNSTEATSPSIDFINGKIEVNKGTPGIEVDQKRLRAEIGRNLSLNLNTNIEIPIIKIDNTLTDIGVLMVKSRAEKYLDKKISLKFDYDSFDYQTRDLIKFVNPNGGFNDDKITNEIINIANKINRDPQNPKFNFDSGKVSEFLPALDGIEVKNEKLKENMIETLNKFETSNEKSVTLEIPVTKTPSEVTTDKINNLGIKELIGRGTSTYYHSIPGRVHNVVLAASRINGILVKPGEIFSFNESLGDVSAFTGYQQAYIISEGKTILGDGGGVCQVSSTLFRALLNAGLPITERSAHAYRVGYYEQSSPPGFDATVYGPSPDLKFKNDTSNYILIVANSDPKHYSLVFEIYGTSDGRKVTISKPVISNIIPALPTVYQDDPTLKTGVLKQIDYSAAGAKVTFDYNVERDGVNLFSKKFISNYRPWAAVYLRGTATR